MLWQELRLAEERSHGIEPDQRERGHAAAKPTAQIRLNVWLETTEGMLFGMGRAQLLEKIEECGSLKKAAEDMGMSYRAAWGKLKKTEEVLGFRLIEKDRGNRKGYRLTEAGMALKTSYRDWHRLIRKEALRAARELFPWIATPGEE